MGHLIFVDCEARGASPVNGTLTEFGAVHEASLATFHGVLHESSPDPANPAIPVVGRKIATDAELAGRFGAWVGKVCGRERAVFVSDNPAYDWQWISALFDRAGMENPFGHSARRLGDFWAGLQGDWGDTQKWKKFRRTTHDHNPVNDALGNVEAFQAMRGLAAERHARRLHEGM